ncbi:MAG: hypothetical protein ACK5LP_00620, partial [Campylobacteraceae bacterium]
MKYRNIDIKNKKLLKKEKGQIQKHTEEDLGMSNISLLLIFYAISIIMFARYMQYNNFFSYSIFIEGIIGLIVFSLFIAVLMC